MKLHLPQVALVLDLWCQADAWLQPGWPAVKQSAILSYQLVALGFDSSITVGCHTWGFMRGTGRKKRRIKIKSPDVAEVTHGPDKLNWQLKRLMITARTMAPEITELLFGNTFQNKIRYVQIFSNG